MTVIMMTKMIKRKRWLGDADEDDDSNTDVDKDDDLVVERPPPNS